LLDRGVEGVEVGMEDRLAQHEHMFAPAADRSPPWEAGER
jgi:hypothetical protein